MSDTPPCPPAATEAAAAQALPVFRLRSWAEQTLYDHRDYLVTAATLEEAIERLDAAQDAVEEAGKGREFEGITTIDRWEHNDVLSLDPAEVIDGDSGFIEIDETGKPLKADGSPADTMDPALSALIAEIARYNDQVNGMEVAPNGDDYNALLDIIRLYGEGRGDAARAIQPSKEEDR